MTLKLLFLATTSGVTGNDIIIGTILICLIIMFTGFLASSDICKKLDEIKDILTKEDK